jgi:hypothetical protein
VGEIAGIGWCLSAALLCIVGSWHPTDWRTFATAGVFALLAIANAIVVAGKAKARGEQ